MQTDAATTLETVTLNGSTTGLPALGFNIARHNIGGSANNVVDDSGTEVPMKTSDKMPGFKFMEAFWLDWMSKDPTSTSWNRDTQKDVLVKLRSQLDTLGLKDVTISSSDENSPSLALSALASMSSDTDVMAAIGKVNTHGNDGQSLYRGTDREPLKKTGDPVKQKTLGFGVWIALDINQMGVSAFVYWQTLDSGAWGLVESNPGDNWIGTPNSKYYVLAQYSRHIRPGMTILSTDNTNTVMAFDSTSKVLVTCDLSSFKAVAGPITAWTTETSGTGVLYESSKVDLSGTSFSASIPAASVMTFEAQGVAV
ncbi:hypothetical protein PHYSODRAFT_321875 [Phytophthora sojae]|uniref:Uncharacterized protein n=1 Tax=Phytophthora sojae (strain P6497) TaxID=1094619 RepID=G4YKB2_PHYSP|nr:hypothetical protein PHYSODRAFT_321875 [Phytophthora sojae]EGZ28196.1 hypothetical protein PHYSODRAFT_321875 [Phytophthora sojae]|eukprot:XP_009515471.1 hypothetical protein PHYSODRAFT_321875 [Phytophthora sojae]